MNGRRGRVAAALAWALLLMAVARAGAEIEVPAGFAVKVHVSGEGYGEVATAATGIPSTPTLAVDADGTTYLARTGRRYSGGEIDDLWPVYRVPAGGARLTPRAETRFFHGPPLPSAQVGAVRAGRELLVTTFDFDRKVGGLYRVRDGRAELLAGGTPSSGQPPLLRQPEAVAVDSAGNVYVADRHQGVVVKLDPAGRVLDPAWARVQRPRTLAVDGQDHLWIGADAEAQAPWQRGPGEIWRVSPAGEPVLVLRGPVAAAIAAGPGGELYVADRAGAVLFRLDASGRRVDFAKFTDGDAPRGLAFVPVTPETRRAGIAGDLLVATVRRGAFRQNEIVRVLGPFETLPRP